MPEIEEKPYLCNHDDPSWCDYECFKGRIGIYRERARKAEGHVALLSYQRDVAIEALEMLYAETEVGVHVCFSSILDQLELRISVTPKSIFHGSLKFHLPRIDKALSLAKSVIIRTREEK